MGYIFNFPAIAGENEPKEVLAKIQEELGEFQAESGIFTFIDDEREFDRLNLKAVIELLDVIHACETMLRLFENFELVDAAANEVWRKNKERGYYEQKPLTLDCDPDCAWLNGDTNRCDRRAAAWEE